MTFLDYREHAVGAGANAVATAYVQVRGNGAKGGDGTLYGLAWTATSSPPH